MATRGGAFILVVLVILLIWLGVYPAPLLNLIRTTTAGLKCCCHVDTQLEKGFPALAPHFCRQNWARKLHLLYEVHSPRQSPIRTVHYCFELLNR
jgi:hypothetical protein